MRRRVLPVAGALLAAAALSLGAGAPVSSAAGADGASLRSLLRGDACPPGSSVPDESETLGQSGTLPADLAARPDLKATAKAFGECVPHAAQSDSALELAMFAGVQSMRAGADSAGAMRLALAQKASMAAAPTAAVSGTGGTWKTLGQGPLIADDPRFRETYGNGFADLAGRISDFAYSPQSRVLWATAAQGGVWESTDVGATWKSIGDNLPFQSTSGIAWTPAGGAQGTLIVLTGDHAFSNDYAGLGVYWTTNRGATWTHASGVPDGALGFRLAVDPTNPREVYAATGKGLFRSVDAGRSFTDVRIASKEATCKTSTEANCFFANIVTDVAVQRADTFGNKGGTVVAALGWRAGRYPNFQGKPQAPHNGIFRSETGDPGTFARLADGSGITPSEEFGRTEFGPTIGDGQNSDYLYAIVQNSKNFTSGQDDVSETIDGDPLGVGINPTGKTSDLDGIYVSPDFGLTWRLMESARQLANPANGSSLNQLSPLGISAGYQVTYNQWIRPDPTRTINGVPSRLTFGLEEIWQNPVPAPQDGAGEVNTPEGRAGSSNFMTIGNYNSAGACLLTAASRSCSDLRDVSNPLLQTTHPDQHAGIYVPDVEGGGVTLVVGNDGGVYRQHTDSVAPFTQAAFGRGAQTGFNTLLPYGIAMAKDGTAYMGLQDNGEAKIDPKDGKIYMIYGGDGVFTLTEPDNSNVVWEEYPGARIALSTDGGQTFTDVSPDVTDGAFVTPLVMDPLDPKHIVTGGRQIVATTAGAATTTESWKQVHELGTRQNPEDGAAQPKQDDPANQVVALGVRGAAIYAGFCGGCDPVKLHQEFRGGLATNVGGTDKPEKGTDSGWHTAKAKGLPQRLITSLTVDPANPRTVYATLGASSNRFWAPIGALGESAAAAAGGYVYKSTDAGETFTDITGNLPKVQATWSMVRNGQLIVANAIGVFASSNTSGGQYAPLGGTSLPNVPVYQIIPKPGDNNTIVAATFGRGAYTYRFTGAAATGSGTTAPPSTGGRGSLPATGLPLVLPLVAAGLLGGGLALRRRRRA